MSHVFSSRPRLARIAHATSLPQPQTHLAARRTVRHTHVHLACMCALVMALCVPSVARAEVRADDIVLGTPANERSIPASELPDIAATHALIVAKDGTAYYERAADDPIKVASTTKVMTALVALEHAPLDTTITVDHAAATVGEASAGLREGDVMTLEEALTGLMVASGNDTAMAIATAVGARIDPASTDPYRTFIDAMNAKATELGCKDTLFENPHGLDFGAWEGNLHATARDMGIIYAAAMENEQFRALDNSDRTEMHVTSADGTPRTLPLIVRNAIRGQQGNIGGKTGTTTDAGDCFLSGFSREPGGEIYIAVYGSTSGEQRFTDTLALANWYYGHFATIPIANTPTSSNGTPILARVACADWTDRTIGATLEDPKQTVTLFSLAGPLEQQIDANAVTGSVTQGATLGSVTYLQNGTAIAEAPLIAATSQSAPQPLEWVMVQFDRVVRFFQGKPGTAETSLLNEAPDPLAYDSWA